MLAHPVSCHRVSSCPINALGHAMAAQVVHLRRYGIHVLGFVGFSLFLIFLYREVGTSILGDSIPIPFETVTPPQAPPSVTRTPCIGPRGRSVQEDRDDQIWAESLDLRASIPLPVSSS
jgi:hypothetical protein